MIKKYEQFIFESNDQFTIYEFLEWLKLNSWSESSINKSDLIKYTEKFIGQGQWLIIETYFDRLFESLRNVDVDYINDRLTELFDEYSYHDMKYAVLSVAYGDISKYHDPTESRYRGLMSVTKISESKKLYIIANFLSKVLQDCLMIYDFKSSIQTRKTPDELLVTSDEWSLKNFKNQNLEIFNDLSITSLYSFNNFLKLKNNFSIENCLDMYRPAIYISIGSFKFMASKISHNKIRKEFEELLPSFLHDIDYDDILWDMKAPQSGEDIEIYDYSLKILLKMS